MGENGNTGIHCNLPAVAYVKLELIHKHKQPDCEIIGTTSRPHQKLQYQPTAWTVRAANWTLFTNYCVLWAHFSFLFVTHLRCLARVAQAWPYEYETICIKLRLCVVGTYLQYQPWSARLSTKAWSKLFPKLIANLAIDSRGTLTVGIGTKLAQNVPQTSSTVLHFHMHLHHPHFSQIGM